MIGEIFAGLALVQATVAGVMASVSYRKKRAHLARCYQTLGEVISVEERPGSEVPVVRHPVIRYQSKSGELVTFTSKFGSSSWKVKAGDRLDILVSEDDAHDGEVAKFWIQWLKPLFFGVMAGGSFLAAVLIYFLFPRSA
jgi:hypothetical protein